MKTLNPERVFTIHIAARPTWRRAGTRVLSSGDLGDARRRGSTPPTPSCPAACNLDSAHAGAGRDRSRARVEARAGGADDARASRARRKPSSSKATRRPLPRRRRRRRQANEFTAIYPAGTVEGTTTYKGETYPRFRRHRASGRSSAARTAAAFSGMVDYLSPNPGYGFISMLPYQYAGGITYNAFHNAGVRCQLNSHAVPAERVAQGRRASAAASRTRTSGSSAAARRRTAAPASRPAT